MSWARSALLAVALCGCSPQAQVRGQLERYGRVFALCKQDTEASGRQPGEHRCSMVVSVAVERSLADSGLPEPEWRALLAEWLADSGYSAYYLSPEQRGG